MKKPDIKPVCKIRTHAMINMEYYHNDGFKGSLTYKQNSLNRKSRVIQKMAIYLNRYDWRQQ